MVLQGIVWYCMVLHYSIRHFMVLHWSIRYFMAFHCKALYCMVSHSFALYCISLFASLCAPSLILSMLSFGGFLAECLPCFIVHHRVLKFSTFECVTWDWVCYCTYLNSIIFWSPIIHLNFPLSTMKFGSIEFPSPYVS